MSNRQAQRSVAARKIKTEPPDLSRIEPLNGRVEDLFTTRARNMLTRPSHERQYGRPRFDEYSFKNSAADELAERLEKTPVEVREWCQFLVGTARYKGKVLAATSQGAVVGNVSPTVRGPAPSHAELIRRARPVDAEGRPILPWGKRDYHLPWVERSEAEVKENAHRYARRLSAVKRGYWDGLRCGGKATCAPDITYAQAARRETGERFIETVDKNRSHWRPDPPQRLWVFVWVLLFEPPWFVIGVLELFRVSRREVCLRWYAGLYRVGKNKSAAPPTENELLTDGAIAGSAERNKQDKPQRKRIRFVQESEILPLVVAAKNGSKPARDRIMLAYRPLMGRIGSRYATIATPFEDLIAVAIIGVESENGKITNGLLYAIAQFDPANGGTFSAFVIRPITWAISRYAAQQRPHDHLSLNATINPGDEENSDLTWQDQATEDVFGTHSSDDEGDAHRAALVAKLDCLGLRERAIFEAHHRDGKSPKELAAEFGLSDEGVRQILAKALVKARKAVKP